MSSETDRYVESVLAAIDLLTCFDSDTGLRLTDLHRRTGLNNSRILRLAGTLISRGFLVFDAATSQYHLGPALFAAGALLEPRYSDVSEAVRPALLSLVSQTHETAFFSVISGQRRLVLAKEESHEALRYTARVGDSRPLISGASGRVALAFCDEATRQTALSQIEETAERDALEKRLNEVRATGHDISEGELTANAFAIAQPVLTSSGGLLGVLTLAGAATKLTPELSERYVELLAQQSRLLPADALAPRLAKSTNAVNAA